MNEMKAQILYDLRERFGSVSGTDLHEFFNQVVGDPSPSGSVEVNADEAFNLLANGEVSVAWNNGGNFDRARKNIRAIAKKIGVSRVTAGQAQAAVTVKENRYGK
jgi:hypothetical protein